MKVPHMRRPMDQLIKAASIIDDMLNEKPEKILREDQHNLLFSLAAIDQVIESDHAHRWGSFRVEPDLYELEKSLVSRR